MPATYKIDKERRIVLSTGFGRVTKDDLMAHQDRLLSDPDFDPSFSQLYDFTHATHADFAASDVQLLAHRDVYARDSRRAILVAKEDHYGLARMFQTRRELAGERGIRVFRELDEAVDWVFGKEQAGTKACV